MGGSGGGRGAGRGGRGADTPLSFRRVFPHTVDIERLVLEIASGVAPQRAPDRVG